MTGRSPAMDASRAPLRGERRAAFLVVGLLCALSLLSGVAFRGVDATPHHHALAVAASVTTTTDGHGTSTRGDQHALVATPVGAPVARLRFSAAVPSDAVATTGSAEVVRTRGPPAGA